MTERILLVDDHPLTREALSSLLEQHGFDVVGQASDGEEAIELARELNPELVLLDLTMPGMDGLTALPLLREAAPESEVVVLTASGTEANLLGAIRAGAAGYLLKSEAPERIADFLRGVAHGEAALSGTVARSLLERVREGGRMGGVPDEIAAVLSAREVEVLLAARRAPLDRRDRRAPLHLRAHRPLARQEPAPQARRVLAARGARAPLRRDRRSASPTNIPFSEGAQAPSPGDPAVRLERRYAEASRDVLPQTTRGVETEDGVAGPHTGRPV